MCGGGAALAEPSSGTSRLSRTCAAVQRERHARRPRSRAPRARPFPGTRRRDPSGLWAVGAGAEGVPSSSRREMRKAGRVRRLQPSRPPGQRHVA
jgi:hypothetical protein